MSGITCVSFLSFIWDALFGRADTEILPKEMEELKKAWADTERAVETEEVRGAVRRTDQVKTWLEDVGILDAAVRDLVNALPDATISGPGYLQKQPQSGDLLRRIRELRSRREGFTVLTLPGGMQEAFSAVKGHLRDDKVAIIAIHAPGGLGKSTLLQYLSNEFTGRSAAAVTAGEECPVKVDAAATADEVPRPLLGNMEEALSQVRGFLRNDGDRVRIIGVPGSGAGVGKTTLLRKIRDEFRAEGSRDIFDKVIYATVSRRESVRRLQQDLVAAMDLQPINVSSADQEKKRPEELIRSALSEKRVLLLLDDVREKLDLASVGLLPGDGHNYKSQIVFTTASPDVCEAMTEQKTVTLGLLDENQSWELFRREAGGDAVLLQDPSSNIRELAQQMAKRCGGRPLALVTVGRAMADKQLPVEWSHAAWALENIITAKSTGRHEGVDLDTTVFFSALKFSYDSLRDDNLRACLLYCALFPEGLDIDRERLVEYWTGEGLLDSGAPANLYVARNRGHAIIRSLESAGLLQSGSTDEERCVQMHAAVRDMALWLTRGGGEDRFVVDEPRAELWSSATRVSLLMQEEVAKFPREMPPCPELSTLLINGCHTHHQQTLRRSKVNEYCRISLVSTGSFSTFLPRSFFLSFPVLRVLDLSHTPLDYLPPTVGSLCELRYLNLSHSGISSLPRELGQLTKLRQLDLRYTGQLRKIPAEAISGLTALQLLNLYGSRFLWSSPSPAGNSVTSVNMKGLEPFENLTELGVSLGDLVPFGNLQNITRLRRAVRFMSLSQMRGLISQSLSPAIAGWSRLRELKLEECPDLEEFIIENNQLRFLQVLQLDHLSRLSTVELGHGDPGGGGLSHSSLPLRRLSHLSISYCDALKPLGWVGHLPCLEEIHVDHCNSMTQLLTGGVVSGRRSGGGEGLPRLRKLTLENLCTLTGISEGSSLRLPSLEDIKVENCPKLPSASKLKARLLSCK